MQILNRDNVAKRFWPKVAITADVTKCWTWQAGKDKDGYGRIKLKILRSEKWVFRNIPAHRFIWEYLNGEIPDGLIVLHKCDNPSCVNPSHLKVGTYADNSKDRDMKGRANHAYGEKLSFPGEKNPNAKLTLKQVQEIRQRYAQGGITQAELGKQYGVAQTMISCIVLQKHWR